MGIVVFEESLQQFTKTLKHFVKVLKMLIICVLYSVKKHTFIIKTQSKLRRLTQKLHPLGKKVLDPTKIGV